MHQIIEFLTEFVQRPDLVINRLILEYNNWIYIFLFAIIFAETGLIVMSFIMPFLPGDALIFAIGMVAAGGNIHIGIIIPLLILAALLGDNLNYFVGKRLGHWLLHKEDSFFIKKKHINKAAVFFHEHGSKAIIIARFIPVVRTIIPFLSGTTNVPYKVFVLYSFIGATLWVGAISIIGYFLGQFTIVKENLEKFILLIILLANLPLIIRLLFNKKKKKEEDQV